MFRLFTHLIGKPFEECKSCETLKQQLEYERANNKELTQTLLSILKPAVSIPDTPATELKPLVLSAGNFSKRRAALEQRDRIEAQILSQRRVAQPDSVIKAAAQKNETDSPLVVNSEGQGTDDSITRLEEQLGVTEEG